MTKEILTDNMKLDFSRVLEIIQYHRTQAVQVINHASILTAWHVGAYVSNKIKNAKWGAKVVQQLAEYIHTQDPTLKGWSRRTIYKMVQFYDVYSSEQFVARATTLKLLPASQENVPISLAQIDGEQIMPMPSAQLQLLTKTTWSNHCSIFQRCTTIDQYIFYILYAEYEHLKNKELERAIKADTYSRMLSDKKWQSEMLKNKPKVQSVARAYSQSPIAYSLAKPTLYTLH